MRLESDNLVIVPDQGDVVGELAQGALRERAIQATTCSFTISDATDPELPLLWVNPAFTITTGYSAEEAIGQNCRFLQAPDTDPAQVQELRTAVAAGRDVTVVLLNHRKDGTPFWNQVALSPIRDSAGRLTHFVGAQTDVTERVEADRRLNLLAETTRLLAATLDVDEAMNRLTYLLVPQLADAMVLRLTGPPGASARAFARHRNGNTDLLDHLGLQGTDDPSSPWHRLLAGGGPDLVNGPEVGSGPASDSAREVGDRATTFGATSMMFVPLTARRHVLGAAVLVRSHDQRPFNAADLGLAADLGRRAGMALDNARLYTEAHDVAIALQRSLLPAALPEIAGRQFAAHYLPAGQDSQVGGDWWDVFALPDGAIGLAIGDVMGHDITAAAAMGQLRSVLRTCAWAGDDPAVVLERMDQLVQTFDMAQLATCIYARLEPADGPDRRRHHSRLNWASAGHLPPIVQLADGSAHLLDDAVGVPIGAPGDARRQAHSLSLLAGSTLLLYTDGLVETRTADIDDDIATLLDKVQRHPPEEDPQALVDHVIGSGLDLTDDVAVLAVSIS